VQASYPATVAETAGRLGSAMADDVKGKHSAQHLSPAAPAVLVIDDDPAVLHSLASVFEACGIAIATARDGLAGLEAFRRISPPVVLSDIIMPEQDGIGLIMEMRRERPGVKIIAMSGSGRIGKSDFLTVAKSLGREEPRRRFRRPKAVRHRRARNQYPRTPAAALVMSAETSRLPTWT